MASPGRKTKTEPRKSGRCHIAFGTISDGCALSVIKGVCNTKNHSTQLPIFIGKSFKGDGISTKIHVSRESTVKYIPEAEAFKLHRQRRRTQTEPVSKTTRVSDDSKT